jgi:PAS domain S-box-containing protein
MKNRHLKLKLGIFLFILVISAPVLISTIFFIANQDNVNRYLFFGTIVFAVVNAVIVSWYVIYRMSNPFQDVNTDDVSNKEKGETGYIDALTNVSATLEALRSKWTGCLDADNIFIPIGRRREDKTMIEKDELIQSRRTLVNFKEFDDLLGYIVKHVKTVISSRFTNLYLKDESGRFILKSSSYEIDPGLRSVFPIEMEEFIDLRENLNPLVTKSLISSDTWDNSTETPDCAYCVFPLYTGSYLFGILEVGLEEGKNVAVADIELMKTLTKASSIAIENAQLFRTMYEEKKKFETILGSVSDGVMSLDENCRITSFNKAAENITGLSRKIVLNKTCAEVFAGKDASHQDTDRCIDEECILRLAEDEKHYPVRSEFKFKTSDDKEKIIEFVTSPGNKQASGQKSYVVVFRDISKIKEIEELRASFIDTVSHELRTPLTSIKCYISTILHPKASFDQTETLKFLNIINEETDKLNRMITDLLEASKLHNDALTIHPEAFELNLFINKQVDDKKELTSIHNFIVDLESSPVVYADQGQVEFVFKHLLENAVKFSPEGGRIRVSTRISSDDSVVIIIEDEGIGVPDEQKSKIFDMFHRVDTRSTRRIYGPGLGLFLAKKIIEAHGRNIWVESGLQGGSRFVFSLPVFKKEKHRK